MPDPLSHTSPITSILSTAVAIWASKSEHLDALPRKSAIISYLTGIRIHILPTALNRIPESLVQEISKWISYIRSNVSNLWSTVAGSVTSFFSRLPGQILSSLKRASIWLLRSPFTLIRWLWGLSGLGPKLLKVGAYGLWLLKWCAIGTAGLVGIVIAGTMLYKKYNSYSKSDTLPSDKTFRGHGTVPRSTRPDIRGDNPQSYRRGNNQEAASDRCRRREADAETRRKRKEEIGREEQRQRDIKAKARRQTLESRSNAFEEWKKESEAMMGDRARIRSIPQPKPTSATCNNSGCEKRMAGLGVTFCTHTMKQLLDAYVEVKRLPIGEKERILREQRKIWHPDRFTRCSEDVKEKIQRVAEEFMKVMYAIK
ncbi:hypothetical protein F5X96DRAFT_660229 [Biscogniauxia mediterranea]|nr:hypothetical protein F5X96DRAFT_660229 [Biscogniauxia mediterranea]